MKCEEVIRRLEERWDPAWALEWDNVGLLVGRKEKEIRRIFVALDATDGTLDQALDFQADLMVTHHPLLFSPIKKIHSGDFIGRRLIKMIQSDLCCYAMHTNFDVLGMAQLNEEALGLSGCEPLEATGYRELPQGEKRPEGIGRVGSLIKPMSLRNLVDKVQADFQIPDVRLYGDQTRMVQRIAVCGGSGKSMVKDALEKKAEALITGDIDYHTGIDALAQGLAIIDAGHYGTEYVFLSYMRTELARMFPEIEVGAAKAAMPFEVISRKERPGT